MGLTTEVMGKSSKGDVVSKYILENNNGMRVTLIDYGANIVAIEIPMMDGRLRDVALGFDTVEEYEANPPFFGAFIGRHANRIGNASFTLNGETYNLSKNEGDNNLHSGEPFYHKLMYKAKDVSDDDTCAVEFSRISEDMEQGYPGRLEVKVTYILNDENELQIVYGAVSDKDTIVNFTNHSYFNLEGHDSGSIENHTVRINAINYTPTDSTLIPTGKIVSVIGTPLDFTAEKRVGQDIDKDMDTLKYGKGYDLNYVIDKPSYDFGLAAVCKGSDGLTMEVYTDLPGLQFYTGNNIGQGLKGKGGAVYGPRSGLCFETQYFPNACNIPEFPSCFVKAGERFASKTIYKFV